MSPAHMVNLDLNPYVYVRQAAGFHSKAMLLHSRGGTLYLGIPHLGNRCTKQGIQGAKMVMRDPEAESGSSISDLNGAKSVAWQTPK